MLTHLKLENFKIWRSTGPTRLAPITLLLGTNSSGKSSLIQSLLLIRQTVKGDDPNLDLDLGNPDADDSVTLGQFKDVLCRHGAASESTSATQVGIEFRWSEDGLPENSTLFSARYNKGPAGSAELAYLRLGKDGQGFSVQRRKPGIYRLMLLTFLISLTLFIMPMMVSSAINRVFSTTEQTEFPWFYFLLAFAISTLLAPE